MESTQTKNYQQYQANVKKGYGLIGFLPTTKTYRSIILAGNAESMTTGGLNEHGLSMAFAVQTLMDMMRDGYQGTEFDLTAHPAFQVKGRKSPLARPWGAVELFDLLQIRPERALCTPTSGYVFIAQLREWLPGPVGNCLWFAYGPASTSCFVPIYAGVTDLPDGWDQPANFTRMDRAQAQWNFRLVHNLTNSLRYQDAIKDVQRVLKPAEERLLGMQAKVEQTAARVFEKHGARDTETFLTDYARQCTTKAGCAYHELVDYLMLQYLIGYKELAPPALPRIAAPEIPDIP